MYFIFLLFLDKKAISESDSESEIEDNSNPSDDSFIDDGSEEEISSKNVYH